MWVCVRTVGTTTELLRLDARSGKVLDRTGIPVSMVAALAGQVWVANYGYPPPAYTGFVGEFDTATRRLGRSTSVPTALGNGVSSLAVGDGGVWIVGPGGTVTGLRTDS